MVIEKAFNQIYQVTLSASPCESCTVILINLIYSSKSSLDRQMDAVPFPVDLL